MINVSGLYSISTLFTILVVRLVIKYIFEYNSIQNSL